jgi:hypothetical protein
VIDLSPEHERLYLVCLEDWPGAEIAEAGDHKARWLDRMRGWPPATGKRPETVPGRVLVTGCVNGWCPAQNLAFERARRAAAAFGDRVEVRMIDTSDRATMLAWGQSDALFVDGAPVRTGPPPSEAKLAALIGRRVRRLATRGLVPRAP